MLNISYHKRGKKTESKKLLDLVEYSAFFQIRILGGWEYS